MLRGTSLLIVRWKIIRVLLVPNNCYWNVGTTLFEETTVKRTTTPKILFSVHLLLIYTRPYYFINYKTFYPELFTQGHII